MKKMMTLAVILCCCGVFAVDFVRNGKIVFDAVVLPVKPGKVESYAAEELIYHLKRSTGKILPVIRENLIKPGKRYIFIGSCKANRKLKAAGMQKNSGVIDIAADALRFAGNDGKTVSLYNTSLGTYHAVCTFLERFMGVRWLWPGKAGEVIPAHRDLQLPEKRIAVKSEMLSTLWRVPSRVKSYAGWQSEQNCRRFFSDQIKWLMRHRFCHQNGYSGGHAFITYWKRFHKTNPDFFNLLPDGTRRKNPFGWSRNNPKHISMCVSNPALVQKIVELWSKNPKNLLNLNENDTSGLCVCANCLKADESPVSDAKRLAEAKKRFKANDAYWHRVLGSTSNRYCKWILAAQKEADKINPNHRITALIYANYNQPPAEHIKLNDRIYLRFCPPFMYPFHQEKIDKFKRQWAGWAKTGAVLQFRPNFTHDGHYFPIQYQEMFYDVYNFCADHGMKLVDMDSLTGHYSTQGLVNYIIAKLNHDRKQPLAEIEDEFYSAFGKAKPFVKEYFDYVTKVSMKSGFDDPFKSGAANEGGILWLDLFKVAHLLFTPEVMAKCTAILDKAANAPGLDALSAERVKMLQIGIEHAKLVMAAQAEFVKYRKGASIKAFDEAVVKLDAYRASVEHTQALNMTHIRARENRHWRRNLPIQRFKKQKSVKN